MAMPMAMSTATRMAPQTATYVLGVLLSRSLDSGANTDWRPQSAEPKSNPYQPVGDFLSNVARFKIIESTLRGEIF
jgi:hypothetical protein